MPTYEYRCKACGDQLEVVQAFTDDALTTCPSCGAAELRKVFGSVGIAFKGTGFYKNDSRSSSKSSSTSADKAPSTDTTKAPADTPSSTPAATPAASTASATTPA